MKRTFVFIWILLLAGLAGAMHAEPTLRLSSAALGPIPIAVGANGPQQAVEAFNVGDGALDLTVTGSADWLVPAVGAQTGCTSGQGVCLPINIALQTAALPQGIRTGTVTVTDPNAFDAPQTITVTIQMGGGVPDQVDLFVAPNGSTDELAFETANQLLQTSATTQSGGQWLSLVVDGFGSFRFPWPYRIQVSHISGLAEGTYNGSVEVVGSTFGPDNKNVPVTMRVTSEPIATLIPERLSIRVAQDSIQPQWNVVVNNRGMGTLNITGAQTDTGGSGDWLSAEKQENLDIISVYADIANLVPGVYEGTVAIDSNAVNVPLEVPVEIEVVAQNPPITGFGGVVNNNTFDQGEPIAQGGIGAIFGEQLSYTGPSQGTEIPLVTELGGAQVLINDVPAPLYYTSYGQINFQVPYDATPGTARATVIRDGQAGNTVAFQVAARVPRLLRLGVGNYGIIVNQDGTLPMPVTADFASHRTHKGDALVIYAIGLGPTTPAVASGAGAPAAEPYARVSPTPVVYFGSGFTGGTPAEPFYVGLTPNLVGLYQINVYIPGNAPIGDNIPVRIEGDGVISNTVEIAIE